MGEERAEGGYGVAQTLSLSMICKRSANIEGQPAGTGFAGIVYNLRKCSTNELLVMLHRCLQLAGTHIELLDARK